MGRTQQNYDDGGQLSGDIITVRVYQGINTDNEYRSYVFDGMIDVLQDLESGGYIPGWEIYSYDTDYDASSANSVVLDFKGWCKNRDYDETGFHALVHEAKAQNPGARAGNSIWGGTSWAQAAINQQASKVDLVNSVAHELGHAAINKDLDGVSSLMGIDQNLHELGIIERRDYYPKTIGLESPMGDPGLANQGDCDEDAELDTYRKLYSD